MADWQEVLLPQSQYCHVRGVPRGTVLLTVSPGPGQVAPVFKGAHLPWLPRERVERFGKKRELQ